MKITNLFAATVVLSFLASFIGCSGGVGSGEDSRAQQARDSKALEDMFSVVQGSWGGTVTSSEPGVANFTADLKLYVYFVQDGSNPDGSVKLRPTLRGRFQPRDFVTETDALILVGDYDRAGLLKMSAQATVGTASPATQVLSLRGVVVDGKMNLEITRAGGQWGNFSGVQTSRASTAPSGGEQAEYRERFLRIIGPLEGRYSGRMKSVDGNDYGVEISLIIIEQRNEMGTLAPVLVAQYRRLDAPVGTLEWSLSVDLNSQNGQIVMRENSSSTGSGVAGGNILSLSGSLATMNGENILRLTVRNRSSILGSLEATKHDSRVGGGSQLPSR